MYCGNLILPDLRPASARYLGNSYFSDGAATYFCSMHSRLNRELEPLDEFWQKLRHRAGAGPKPQTYLYPYVALPASARPTGRCWTATWPPTARARSTGAWRCPRRTPPRCGACRWAGTATCGPAMISSPMGAASISISSRAAVGRSRVARLHGGRPVPAALSARPARRHGVRGRAALRRRACAVPADQRKGRHVYQALFASKDGLYFYNTQTRQLERAGDDPFASGAYVELSPYVYSDGTQTLFLKAEEAWARSTRGSGGGLVSRSTLVNRLRDAPDGAWIKRGVVYHNFGTVWQKGGTLYYFDEMGPSQLISSPIYQILDPVAADFLLRSQETRQIKADDIRKLIRGGRLAVPQYETVLEAKTRYRKIFSIF